VKRETANVKGSSFTFGGSRLSAIVNRQSAMVSEIQFSACRETVTLSTFSPLTFAFDVGRSAFGIQHFVFAFAFRLKRSAFIILHHSIKPSFFARP
jgi:hypothetical protein